MGEPQGYELYYQRRGAMCVLAIEHTAVSYSVFPRPPPTPSVGVAARLSALPLPRDLALRKNIISIPHPKW